MHCRVPSIELSYAATVGEGIARKGDFRADAPSFTV
jgi:hypothetical protein